MQNKMGNNELFDKRYKLEKALGGGAFSQVWLAKDTWASDVDVALKIYTLSEGVGTEGANDFSREFAIVANANHTNLLTPKHFGRSDDGQPYLVLPFCREGSILKDVGQFSERQAWKLLADISAGLAYLHKMNPPIVHQDIKPDNILIDGDKYLLTDFGVSTKVKNTISKTVNLSQAGTKAYMAPERFEDPTPINANDIYSLGATVYEMLTGDVPFGEEGGMAQALEPDLEPSFIKFDFNTQQESTLQISDSLKNILCRCVNLSPWERPTAEQLHKIAEDYLNRKTRPAISSPSGPTGRPTELNVEIGSNRISPKSIPSPTPTPSIGFGNDTGYPTQEYRQNSEESQGLGTQEKASSSLGNIAIWTCIVLFGLALGAALGYYI